MKQLDKHAYDVVCNWAKVINFNPIYKGIDYSLIIRFYLWDKIGRAIRIKHGLSFNEISVYTKDTYASQFYFKPFQSKGSYSRQIIKKKKIIFIPFQAPHTKIISEELKKLKSYRIISKQITEQFKKKDVIKDIKFDIDEDWCKELTQALFKSLHSLEIDLIREDVILLKKQIEGAIAITQLAFKELKKYKPSALYVHSDNHPPYINYILVANYLGIPTFTYQHGLDCEHLYLDDCFADFIGVWSVNRKKQYQLQSAYQPKAFKEIGNIFLDSINKEVSSNKLRTHLLFITRPHLPIKCYSPSQNHLIGFNILQTILKVINQNKDLHLIIKPHPMDDSKIYEELIQNKVLTDRVYITNDSVSNLMNKVDVIITEDSTAGAEAMRYHKPTIHAHFGQSNPVLPFIEFGAALPGRKDEELLKNINYALQISEEGMNSLIEGQKKLIKELIPKGEVKKLVNFIIQNS